MQPGPNNELIRMVEKEAIPMLQALGALSEEEAYLQIRTFGSGESSVEEMMQPIAKAYPDLVVAYWVHYGIVDVRLSSRDRKLII